MMSSNGQNSGVERQECRARRLLFAGTAAIALSACSSAEVPSSETIGRTRSAVAQRAWYSLGAANHNANLAASQHMICAAEATLTRDQVRCYRPSGYEFEGFNLFQTNWGGTKDPQSGFYRIPGGGVKSVAILKRKDYETPPNSLPREDMGMYEIHVLSEDDGVRSTMGYSDAAYSGTNFKTYSVYMSPTASDGTRLRFRKIMWVNEDSLSESTGPRRRLFALTYDNKAYFNTRENPRALAWYLWKTGVKDMGNAGGIGATFLMTDGRVWYDSFSDDPNDFSGYLPSFTEANITAVGGLWALTDRGTGGACDTQACAGDERRVLRFSWKLWKWEWWYNQLVRLGWDTGGFFPVGQPEPCTACSPEILGSIVDSHGFGRSYINPPGFLNAFNIGPLVGEFRQRVYFYNPSGYLPYVCNSRSSCAVCESQEDGTYCGSNTREVCSGNACKACGGLGQPCCVGLTCPGSSALTCSGGTCRSFDGENCSTNADCSSNKCTTFYLDQDNDSYGSAFSGFRRICGTTPPAVAGNWRTNDLDCCDSNPEANPGYTGGPRAFGAVGCARPFDWNCNGIEKQKTPVVNANGCTNFTTQATCPGVVFTSATACGVQKVASACGWDGSSCLNARGALWTQTCD